MLGGIHNEAGLQQLMHDHPSVPPVHMIEPGFGELIAIACECLARRASSTFETLWDTAGCNGVRVKTILD